MTENKGRPDLDSLIERFEEDVRKRPTPDELAAAERALRGAAALPEPKPQPKPRANLVIAPAPPVVPAVQAAVVSAPPIPELEVLPADIEGWWNSGQRVELELPGGRVHTIFTRVLGTGPWLTMIHGFPTSSWDWVPILPHLARRHRVLAFDLLGFGDSDKPPAHDWSTFEQADIVEALWKHFGVAESRVVAHDVGLTVALELLARQQEGRLAARVSDLTLLNGGAYAAAHRPRPIQVWLQRPLVGAVIARMLSEAGFSRALAEIFSSAHQPTEEALHQHWLSVARRDGSRNYHRLIKYLPERRANAARWEGALDRAEVPTRFIWGMADPVSGAPTIEVVRGRRPGAEIVELANVGHYPQLEAPERVAAAVLRDDQSPAPAAPQDVGT